MHFEHPAQETTLLDYLHEVEHMRERVARLEQAIVEAVKLASLPLQEVIADLQAFAASHIFRRSRLRPNWARFHASQGLGN